MEPLIDAINAVSSSIRLKLRRHRSLCETPGSADQDRIDDEIKQLEDQYTTLRVIREQLEEILATGG